MILMLLRERKKISYYCLWEIIKITLKKIICTFKSFSKHPIGNFCTTIHATKHFLNLFFFSINNFS